MKLMPSSGFCVMPPTSSGGGDAEQVVDRRRHVADVDVGVAHLAMGVDSVGPGDDCGVGDAALVRGVALEQLVRRVERHRPPDGVVVVGLGGAAQLVVEAEALLDGVDVPVEELDLVDRAVRTALAAGSVVGDDDDDGVVELTRLLEVVEDPADLRVGVGQEAGEHLGHPAEQPLLLVVQGVPRPDGVLVRPGFAVGGP